MSSRRTRAWRVAVAVLTFLFAGPFSPAGAADDDQPIDVIRDGIAQDGYYLHPAAANGDIELWGPRIEEATQRAEFPFPIVVAMWPDSIDRSELLLTEDAELPQRLGVDRGIVLRDESGFLYDYPAGALPLPAETRWRAIKDQTRAIGNELLRYNPDPQGRPRLLPVAEAWISLRLAAKNPPTARQLADDLINDNSVFVDQRRYDPSRTVFDDDDRGPLTAICFGVFITLTLALLGRAAFIALRYGSGGARLRNHQAPRDRWDAELTPVALEAELTELAEQIAASDVQPGEPAYERAQAAADAAARYVDSDASRDRVGVHLLVEDGLTALLGEPPAARCYFNPHHRARTSVSRSSAGIGGAEVPACHDCARAIKTGSRPAALMLPDVDGDVAPYFVIDDVWSRTGYGALDPAWAAVVLKTSLGLRDGGA